MALPLFIFFLLFLVVYKIDTHVRHPPMPRAGEPRVEAVYCCVSATVKEAVKEIIDWISGAAVLFNQKSPAGAAAASAHPATQFP